MTSTVVFVDSDVLMVINLYTPEYSSTVELIWTPVSILPHTQ